MKISIVTTTIRIPYFIDSYIKNFKKYNHKHINFIIIGDLKTHKGIKRYIKGLNAKPEHSFDYWDVYRQKEWLKRFPRLDRLIPYNSIQRRNIGYIIAYEAGSDIIISVDDDNYAATDDFIGMHSIVATTAHIYTVRSSTSWFNPCDYLETRTQRRIYPRGFPYSKRGAKEKLRFDKKNGRISCRAIINTIIITQ